MSTKIEYVDVSWNPISGCTPCSAGCANCYASRMAKRLAGRYGYPKRDPFKVTLHPDKLDKPLHWRKPRRVFVCSMGDLFHEDVNVYDIGMVLGICALARQHTFLCLTKRPQRMREVINWMRYNEEFQDEVTGRMDDRGLATDWDADLPNVWLGVTAENQETSDKRVVTLMQTPAAKHFVSVEPMLQSLWLTPWLDGRLGSRLDWVVCGGETGPGAREMKVEWARSLRDQCAEAGVAFFFKKMAQGRETPPDLMVREYPK